MANPLVGMFGQVFRDRFLEECSVFITRLFHDGIDPKLAPHWADRPISELIDHILVAYHGPLERDLARLLFLSEKVARTHGSKDGRLSEIRLQILSLAAELHTLGMDVLADCEGRLQCREAV